MKPWKTILGLRSCWKWNCLHIKIEIRQSFFPLASLISELSMNRLMSCKWISSSIKLWIIIWDLYLQNHKSNGCISCSSWCRCVRAGCCYGTFHGWNSQRYCFGGLWSHRRKDKEVCITNISVTLKCFKYSTSICSVEFGGTYVDVGAQFIVNDVDDTIEDIAQDMDLVHEEHDDYSNKYIQHVSHRSTKTSF